MIEVVDFKREHIADFLKEERFSHIAPHIDEEALTALETKHQTKTVMADGKVILVGGILDKGDIGEAWAMVDKSSRNYFLSVHRLVHSFLKRNGAKPIEAIVDVNFLQGQKWMGLLGFSRLNAEFDSCGVRMSLYRKEGCDGC